MITVLIHCLDCGLAANGVILYSITNKHVVVAIAYAIDSNVIISSSL